MRSSWIIAGSVSGRLSITDSAYLARGRQPQQSGAGGPRCALLPFCPCAFPFSCPTEKGVFQYCMMARPETKTSPGFGIARGASQLTLAMFSQKWKLEKGTSYPVTLVAGSAREELQARFESATAVTVDLTGRDAFVEGLARVPALEVRAAASTLRLPLDQGAAALARLRDCLAAEAPVASNPFASAAERPGGGQAANPFKAPAQPEATAPAAKPAAPAAAPRMSDEAYAKARARSGSPGRRLHDGHRERPRDAGGPGHRRVEPRLRLLQER